MHTNLSVTDGIYGILSEIHVKARIVELNQEINSNGSNDVARLIFLTRQLLNKLK